MYYVHRHRPSCTFICPETQTHLTLVSFKVRSATRDREDLSQEAGIVPDLETPARPQLSSQVPYPWFTMQRAAEKRAVTWDGAGWEKGRMKGSHLGSVP